MSATILPNPVFRAFKTSGGAALAGGKLYFYQAGTSTPQAAYSDQTGATPLTNPVILDANGEAEVWLKIGLKYKINLTDANDVQQPQYPVDQVFDAGGQLGIDLADTSSSTKGDYLIGVKSTLTGGVARTQHDKNADWVSVKDFGAVGDGTNDDTTAIQNAINTLKNVFIPNGVYKITSSLVIKGSICGENGVETIIKPATDTFAAFINQSGTAHAKYSISKLRIDFGYATGNVRSTNANSAAFYYTGATDYDYEFRLEDIWIRYPYYGIRDDSANYMSTYQGVRIDDTYNAFWFGTNSKTTLSFNNCYANRFIGFGWYLYAITGVSIRASAMDGGNNTSTSSPLFYCGTCYGVSINGWDYEVNTVAAPFSALMRFESVQGFEINGMRGYLNVFASGSDEVYGIDLIGSTFGTIKNTTIGTPNTDTSTGTGKVFSVIAQDTAKVTLDGCRITTIPGTSGSKNGYLGTETSECTIMANCSQVELASISGANTKLVNLTLNNISSNIGDTDFTIAAGVSNPIILFNSNLATAPRTLSFAAVGNFTGATFRVLRTAASAGAYDLTVASTPSKTVLTNSWADFVYTGTAWTCCASGTL